MPIITVTIEADSTAAADYAEAIVARLTEHRGIALQGDLHITTERA